MIYSQIIVLWLLLLVLGSFIVAFHRSSMALEAMRTKTRKINTPMNEIQEKLHSVEITRFAAEGLISDRFGLPY